MRFIIISFLIFINLTLHSQVSTNELQKIVGQWEGTLTYTDYQDDVSKSTLQCQMIASWKGKKCTIAIGFTEPNGSVVYDKTTLKVLKQGSLLKFDGEKYQVDDFKTKSGEWKLVMSCSSKDNNRKAKIRQTIIYTDTTLTLTKEVNYEGTPDFFIRNEYAFGRK